MSLETRPLTTHEEVVEAESIFAHAFGIERRHDLGEEFLTRLREQFEPDWHLAAFEDGEMTAMMCVIPNEMYINGAAMGFGTVSPVASSPLHRRKGHTGALLRYSLGLMRERGQVISGLYTPHPAFYRRYGWEIASEGRRYSFKPKDLALQVTPSQRGRFRALRPADWAQLQPVHSAYASRANGAFARNERWWNTYVLVAPWRGIHEIVVWDDDAGEPQGYAVYLLPTTGEDAHKVIVLELIALTGDARLNLLSFFGRYDIHNEVIINASTADTLPLLFSDTERLETTERFAVMLRICDFEAAMRARPAARPDETADVTLRLEDRDAPWNEGTWRVGVSEGRTLVERTDAGAELTVSERVIGPLFNGHVRPSVAFESGLVAATGEEALERADRVFAVRRPPFFVDSF